MFNFLKINDPFLGNGTFGQLARLGPERCAVMHMHLSELENGGWREKKEFKRFVDAYSSSTEKVKAYLDKCAVTFFRRFRAIFDRHMVTKWTSTETLHYLLGGDPRLAKEFARWLVYHEAHPHSNEIASASPTSPTNATLSSPSTPPSFSSVASSRTSRDSNNMSPSSSSIESNNKSTKIFTFKKQKIILGRHHTMDHENKEDIEIDLRESMLFLTEYVDPSAILCDPFIKANWTYIVALSKEKEAVNLFCKKQGVWDKSTWNDMDYEPFVFNIVRSICIHSSHQQRCENYVQLCGLLAQTGVGEVRRTCRAIINSCINRRFNPWVLMEVNKRRKAKGEAPVKRVQGKEKFALYLEFIEQYFETCDKGLAAAPDGLVDQVRDRLGKLSSKASAKEQQAFLASFHEAVGKPIKFTKAQEAKGIQPTAHVEGAVFLRHLAKCNNTYLQGSRLTIEKIINDEMRARKLDFGKKTPFISKKQAIRTNEYARRVAAGEDWKESGVQFIVPQSKSLKHFLDHYYPDILNEVSATVAMETEELQLEDDE
jgi:hypothetical protein